MSEVNYRRNGMKYSTSGKCWGVPKEKAKRQKEEGKSGGGGEAKPKSSRERRALKKDGKR